MRVLLDTHAFLWWIDDAPTLTRRARTVLANPANECWFSLASCWEMAIKISLGKLRLPGTIERFIPEQLAANAFRQLSIDFRHVTRVATLPFHHRDPSPCDRASAVAATPRSRRSGAQDSPVAIVSA